MRLSLAWVVLPTLLAAQGSEPARVLRAPVSLALPSLQGQCLASLDVVVDRHGEVSHVSCLYGSLPLTDRLAREVMDWTFRPAVVQGEAQASHVLVAGLFRPSTLRDAGPCGPPDQVRRAPPSLPVPVVSTAPVYPPGEHGGGVVTVEVEIRREGDVHSARTVGGPTPLDAAARQAARGWHFRFEREPAPSRAYLVFGFQASGPGAGTGRRARAGCLLGAIRRFGGRGRHEDER